MMVMDASFALEVALQTSLGRGHLEAALSGPVHAPHLLDIECLSVLRRLVRTGEISEDRAVFALRNLASWGIVHHAHGPLAARIWALRDCVSAYDGAYVALAERLQAPLWTCDARLSRSSGHAAEIVLAARH